MKLLSLILVLVLCSVSIAPGQSSVNYRIEADVFDNGGLGRASPQSAGFVAMSSVGQSTGLLRSASTNFLAASGYVCAVCRDTVASSVFDAPVPREAYLEQNYPNPFRSATTIELLLQRREHVTLRIFNLLGEEVSILVDETLPAGKHTVRWEARGLKTGLYFYRLGARDWTVTKTLTLIR